MNTRILSIVVLVLLAACGKQEPAEKQEKSVGGQIGDSYKGMLDSAAQSVQYANDQMQRSDNAIREIRK
jgi:hypothetical protein